MSEKNCEKRYAVLIVSENPIDITSISNSNPKAKLFIHELEFKSAMGGFYAEETNKQGYFPIGHGRSILLAVTSFLEKMLSRQDEVSGKAKKA